MAGKGRAQGGMSGGARPGAGGKKRSTVVEQETRRSIALDVFSPEEWRQTLTGWMQAARETKNYGLLFPLLPYLMGSPKQEVAVTFDIAETAQELAEKYGTTPERVVSIVERLKAKQAG